MARQFKPYVQEKWDTFNFNPHKDLPPSHKARILSDVIDTMDLTEVYQLCNDTKGMDNDPKMLFKVMAYARMDNIDSYDKIEDNVCSDSRYAWLTNGDCVSASTLRQFMERIGGIFEDLFAQVVKLLADKGVKVRKARKTKKTSTNNTERELEKIADLINLVCEKGTLSDEDIKKVLES